MGEIRIRSVQNSPGYWHRPEDTAAVFDAEGWLHTGDAGYLDDEGYVFLTDRIKDMIVTGAENVYPVEVESVLSSTPTSPTLRWSAFPTTGGARRSRRSSYDAGSGLTEQNLIAWCRGRLAGFKRPTSVDFAEELPRNPTGKLLKRVLRAPYWPDADDRPIGSL